MIPFLTTGKMHYRIAFALLLVGFSIASAYFGMKFASLSSREEDASSSEAAFPERGYLGIYAHDIPERGPWIPGSGLLVVHVIDGAPVSQIGLQAGDVVTKIGPIRLTKTQSARDARNVWRAGTRLAVTFVKEGKLNDPTATATGTARLVSREQLDDGLRRQRGIESVPTSHPRGFLGIMVGTSPGGGVMIGQVGRATPAEESGLRPGDVIVQINGEPVSDQLEFYRIVRELVAGLPCVLQVRRAEKGFTISVITVSEEDLPPESYSRPVRL
ncbi:PDZ domain-containing protein [Stratiformator vulcanicus]|uniref:PDZ domain-containing protein n=1 Tax=Stratiformator vulcanicus TaxID=2527980 RepID=UPI002877C080|nr:PDZ domain-containing protein [Stratiformator vulcanicus]